MVACFYHTHTVHAQVSLGKKVLVRVLISRFVSVLTSWLASVLCEATLSISCVRVLISLTQSSYPC